MTSVLGKRLASRRSDVAGIATRSGAAAAVASALLGACSGGGGADAIDAGRSDVATQRPPIDATTHDAARLDAAARDVTAREAASHEAAAVSEAGATDAPLRTEAGVPIATIKISTTPSVAISSLLYGVNYEWNLVPASDFATWNESISAGSHYTLLRYASGWNAEHYDWQTNQEVPWSTGTGNCYAPDAGADSGCPNHLPGAAPDAAIAAAPNMDIIVPSALFIKSGASADLTSLVTTASTLVQRYGSKVRLWEIGNEWWNQGSQAPSAVAKRLARYEVLVSAVAPAMKKAAATAGATIEVYATIDWQAPTQASTLAAGAEEAGSPSAWAAVDGISIHPYCGNSADAGPTCATIPSVVSQIQALSGVTKIFASEWSVSVSTSVNDQGLENANLTVAAFGIMEEAGVRAATYWPGADFVPSVSLVGGAPGGYASTATGLAVGWLSQFYEGTSLTVSGDLPALAATTDGNVTVIVPTGQTGQVLVELPLAGTGLSTVQAAEVLYASTPTSGQGHVVPVVPTIIAQSGGNVVQLLLNPGTTGRGTSGEIARITLAP